MRLGPVGIIHEDGTREFKSEDGKVHVVQSGHSINVKTCGGHSMEGSGDDMKIDGERVVWEPVKHGVSGSRYSTPALELKYAAQDDRIRQWKKEQAANQAAIDVKLVRRRERLWLLALLVVFGLCAAAGVIFGIAVHNSREIQSKVEADYDSQGTTARSGTPSN